MVLNVVLDTSVIIKWFRQEEVLAGQALAWREAYHQGRAVVSVPSLVVYELSNVMRYKGEMTTKQVQDALLSFYDMGLEQVFPSGQVMCRAVEIAREYDITVYDATFVALAESLDASFVTADENLVKQLKNLHFVRFLV